MRAYLFIFLILMPAFACRAAERDDRPLVQWYFVDIPPAMILEGDGKGSGYVDRIVDLFVRSMPQYRHEAIVSSVTRMVATMQSRDGICTGGLLRTPERERILAFSNSFYPVLVNRLVTSKEKRHLLAPYLDEESHVDLTALAMDPVLVAGYVGDRFYSPLITDFIKLRTAVDPDGRLRVLIPNDRFSFLLQHNRIDFAFGLAAEVYYQSMDENGGKGDGSLISFAVKGEPVAKPGGFACSKGPMGRRVAAEMNRLITDPAIREQIRSFYVSWLDEDARADFEKAVADEASPSH